MSKNRRNDTAAQRSWFRTDRLLEENGQWFFLTREGTVEGPFDSKTSAVDRMEVYAKIMEMDLLADSPNAQLQHSA